jgi:hypothetical protein
MGSGPLPPLTLSCVRFALSVAQPPARRSSSCIPAQENRGTGFSLGSAAVRVKPANARPGPA